MIYLLIVIVLISTLDIKSLVTNNRKKEIFVYIAFMLLVTALGVFYYSKPERDSFTEMLLSIIGKEGET